MWLYPSRRLVFLESNYRIRSSPNTYLMIEMQYAFLIVHYTTEIIRVFVSRRRERNNTNLTILPIAA